MDTHLETKVLKELMAASQGGWPHPRSYVINHVERSAKHIKRHMMIEDKLSNDQLGWLVAKRAWKALWPEQEFPINRPNFVKPKKYLPSELVFKCKSCVELYGDDEYIWSPCPLTESRSCARNKPDHPDYLVRFGTENRYKYECPICKKEAEAEKVKIERAKEQRAKENKLKEEKAKAAEKAEADRLEEERAKAAEKAEVDRLEEKKVKAEKTKAEKTKAEKVETKKAVKRRAGEWEIIDHEEGLDAEWDMC